MARVTFTKDFDYEPQRGVIIAYKEGKTYPNVRREAADQAIAENRAVEVKTPRRRKAPAE